MIRRTFVLTVAGAALGLALGLAPLSPAQAASKEIVYLTPSLNVTFWRYLSKGIESVVKKGGYEYQALDSENNAQKQLRNAQDVIARNVAGIVISPTDSSSCPSVLDLAEKAGIPVVIADIGTNSGSYVSFISSDNLAGAYGIGKALGVALKEKGWQDGSVGMVAIPQARKNGQLRTKGFRDAMKEAGITKEAGMQQMQTFTADETFKYTQDMLTANPDMRGIFIQSDQQALGAMRAIRAARRQGEVLIAAFDGIPEFVKLIKEGAIVGSGMQQPYLMGVKSAEALVGHLDGKKQPKEVMVPILVATEKNIDANMKQIQLNVFANEL